MTDQLTLAIIAIAAGVVVGILAFVPYVAIVYRRHGRLTFRRFSLAFGLLVYFLAIWAYTLLPLPDPDSIRCTTPQLDALRFADDLAGAAARGHPLTDPAVLQLALNVLLFIPLGFFVRLVWHRGAVVSVFVGFALSLFIETTQLTGVWGLYPCAYRLFDVDDLLVNTLGALVGSLLSLLIPLKYRARPDQVPDARLPQPVTALRRLLAMLCDVLTVVLTGFAAALTVVLTTEGMFDSDAETQVWVDAASAGVPLALTLGYTMIAGRTIGHAAVQLRYTGSPLPAFFARLLRFVGGIGGYQLLALPPGLYSWLLALFVVVSVVLVFTTKDRRGLPGLVSGQRLVDSRPVAEAPAREELSPPGARPDTPARPPSAP